MKRQFLERTWRNDPAFRALCDALLRCKTRSDVAAFLRDVTTLSEMKAMSERLEAADLLLRGLPYREVAKLTGASTTTVTRVAAFLQNGEGGYRNVLSSVANRHHHTASPVRRGRRGA